MALVGFLEHRQRDAHGGVTAQQVREFVQDDVIAVKRLDTLAVENILFGLLGV